MLEVSITVGKVFILKRECLRPAPRRRLSDEKMYCNGAVFLSNRLGGGETIGGEEKTHFRRVCRHAIGAADEGLLLAVADNNTFSRRRRRVHMYTGGQTLRANNGDDVPTYRCNVTAIKKKK